MSVPRERKPRVGKVGEGCWGASVVVGHEGNYEHYWGIWPSWWEAYAWAHAQMVAEYGPPRVKDKRDECGCHRDCTTLPHQCEVPCRWPACLNSYEEEQLMEELRELPE